MGKAAGSLLELLQVHGVPERAGRIYLAATRSGPQTAAELARIAGLNRVEGYRYIRQLESQGILRASGRRPMRFAALPPNELIDQWIHRTADDLRRLEAGRDQMISDWRESVMEVNGANGRKFEVLEDRDEIQRFLVKRLGTAEREVDVATSGFGLTAAVEGGVARALEAAHERGVKVRVVTEIARANLPDGKHFASFSDLRHANEPVTNRAVVIDRREVLVFVTGAEGLGTSASQQIALWSSDPSFLRLAREYHRRMWHRATRAERRIVELEAPPTAVLPVVRGHEGDSFQRLKEVAQLGMRASGVQELRLDLPELIESIARQLGRQIANEVGGDTPQTVAKGLQEYYQAHAMGRLTVVRDRPLVVRVTQCFACVRESPEVGRVLCSELLRSVFESRIGSRCDVTKPDPRRHADRGCMFTVTAG